MTGIIQEINIIIHRPTVDFQESVRTAKTRLVRGAPLIHTENETSCLAHIDKQSKNMNKRIRSSYILESTEKQTQEIKNSTGLFY